MHRSNPIGLVFGMLFLAAMGVGLAMALAGIGGSASFLHTYLATG